MSLPTAIPASSHASNTSALIDAISRATTEATRGAIEQVKPVLEELIMDTEKRLSTIHAPKPMSVVINGGTEKKLSKSPSPLLPRLLVHAALGEATMIKGPTGSGKTTVANQVAEALGLKFYRFVFSADMGTSALFGRQTVTGFVESCIVQAARNGGVILLDEMDAANESLLVSINGLTDKSGALYNPVTGESVEIHKDLVVIACCNTFGKGPDHVYTGRNRLDAASLDRFICLELNYSDDLEQEIAKQYTTDKTLLKQLQDARAALKKHGSDEVISTRAIERCHRMHYLGLLSLADVFDSLTKSWPEGLAEQVGLVAETPKKKKGA